jgi:hypothetical protein
MQQEQNNNEMNVSCKNKGFMIVSELLLNNGWHYTVNEPNHILFNKKGNDYDYYEITILKDKIFVSIPIPKSQFQYKTHFTSYFEASEYLESHFF